MNLPTVKYAVKLMTCQGALSFAGKWAGNISIFLKLFIFFAINCSDKKSLFKLPKRVCFSALYEWPRFNYKDDIYSRIG
jgi:hypothetical protein